MDDRARLTRRVVALLEERYGVPRRKEVIPPLDCLILTVLSQSTSDLNRDRAFASLKKAFPTWQCVMEANVGDVEKAIRVGGLSNQKSARIQEILRWVKERFGELSLDCLKRMKPVEAIDTFTQVKGIGVKTVSVVLLFSCGKDVFPVDTHVHRICKRLNLVPQSASAEKTHLLMASLVPKGKAYSFHVNLLKLGRQICRPSKPGCDICSLGKLCRRIGCAV